METTAIHIRLATFDDLPDVQSCARAAYAKYVERMSQKPAPMIADFTSQIKLEQVHIAICDSFFAGYVVFYQDTNHLHLENVAVVPAHSGKGIGKQLIEYVEHAALKKGLHAVELYTNEAMTENLAMYPSLGYVETGRKQQDGFYRVFFRKPV
ncbi:MAG: GNAT family N-acetyltransferase [Cocleimonas sp.]